MEHRLSGVGVLDKAMVILFAVKGEPLSLAELVATTGLPRPTAHRLATALEVHRLLRRDAQGRFALGPQLLSLGHRAAESRGLAEAAQSALAELRDRTGESAQLYVRQDDRRVCIASLESLHGLRTIVSTGEILPLDQGSGGRALLGQAAPGKCISSVAEREPGVASVSAPVVDGSGIVIAAVSVSGPIERLTRRPGAKFGAAVLAAASRIALDSGLST